MKTEKGFVISTREELEAAAAAIVAMKVELNGLAASRTEAVTAAAAPFAERMLALESGINERQRAAYAWCEANEAEVFGESSVLKFASVEVQFKKTAFSVQAKEGWDWKKIVKSLLGWSREGKKYLRFKDPELDKVAIGKDREKWCASEWGKRGIEFAQGRSLVISPPGAGV